MFENFKVPNDLIPSDPRFGCGPSLVPLDYLDSLKKRGVHLLGTSHRKSAIKNLVKELQEGLKKYFHVPSDYLVTLGNGGATCLFDMIALGLVEKKAAHFTCGEFSQKWFKSSKAVPWIKAEEFTVPMGEGIEARDVADADLICATLNETSTGVQLPGLPAVHEGALLAVDATSGAGQMPCDVSKTDIFFFSPQKVFAAEGGLWIAFLSPKAMARAKKIVADKSRYIPPFMSWGEAIGNSEKNQTYNTPAITTIWLANQQVKVMSELGFEKVCAMAEEKAQVLYKWAQHKPYLSCYIKDDKFRSRAVACIDVDAKCDVTPLVEKLEKEKIVYGIDAYRNLGRNQFRISLFHNIKKSDLEKLTKLLSLAIEGELK